jgi:outer membrane lipoprotein LolB
VKYSFLAACSVLLTLTACAPVRMKGSTATLSSQAAREKLLSPRNHWTVQARMAVSDGHHGGSGTLTWMQDAEDYDFVVRGPLTGRSFHLHGGANGAELDGLDGGPLYGPNAQQLLARALGWQVPLAQLRYWIKGLRAPGSPAQLRFGPDHLPSLLQQDGWTVEYRSWSQGMQPEVPQKVFASKGPYHVRVAIQGWTWR